MHPDKKFRPHFVNFTAFRKVFGLCPKTGVIELHNVSRNGSALDFRCGKGGGDLLWGSVRINLITGQPRSEQQVYKHLRPGYVNVR